MESVRDPGFCRCPLPVAHFLTAPSPLPAPRGSEHADVEGFLASCVSVRETWCASRFWEGACGCCRNPKIGENTIFLGGSAGKNPCSLLNIVFDKDRAMYDRCAKFVSSYWLVLRWKRNHFQWQTQENIAGVSFQLILLRIVLLLCHSISIEKKFTIQHLHVSFVTNPFCCETFP